MNRDKHQHFLDNRLTLYQGDLFDALKNPVHTSKTTSSAALDNDKFDLILCNPPYLDAGRMAALPDEYRFEPEIALLAPSTKSDTSDGLSIIRRVIADAGAHLRLHGMLLLEVAAHV